MTTTVNTTVERIELTALDKGAKSVIDGVRGSVSGLRSHLDTVNGALAAIGVTVGAGAMLAFARQVLSANAALDDMAESTGASVEGLSAIQRVARVGGHDFEGLTGQISKTIKGLREGAEEGGRAARAFDFLGVRTRESDGRFRDMSQVLVDMAKALDKYEDGGNKVALVQDALGKGAERYIPLLKDMAEGTDLVATTTARQAEEADKAEKAMRRVAVAFEDSKRVLVNEYTPALTRMLEQMAEGIRIAGGFGNALLTFGTMSPFQSASKAAAQERKNIEDLIRGREQLARMPGYEGATAQIDRELAIARQRLEFAKFMERQGALASVGDGNLDARDLAARGSRRTLSYKSQSEGGERAMLREAEFRAQKQVELEEMAAQDAREAWELYTKGRLDQEKQLREGQAQMMRDWFALIDQEQADAVERGQEYLDSEQNRAEEYLNNQLNMLREAREQGLLTDEEYNERRIELEIRHQQRLTGLVGTHEQQRQRFIKASLTVQAQTIFGELANITAGVAQHNKALFRINQVAGIANAVINAHQGAARTLGSYPWPLAGILAALHYAAGAAQVAAIAGAKFDGGGAGAAPSLAGATAATPVTPVSAAPTGGNRVTYIVLPEGGTVATDSVADLFDRLNEGMDDGHRFVTQRRKR